MLHVSIFTLTARPRNLQLPSSASFTVEMATAMYDRTLEQLQYMLSLNAERRSYTTEENIWTEHEVRVGRGKCHSKEVHSMYSSPNTIRVIKSKKMRWKGHIACMDEVSFVRKRNERRSFALLRSKWEIKIKTIRNYYIFALCSWPRILKTREHNISETGPVSVLR
jgi:hypothetical protein